MGTRRGTMNSSSAGKPPTLMELEAQRQHALFVGRAPELAHWRSALVGKGASVFYVYGPAGIGKTCLLQAFAAEARRLSIITTHLDAREHRPRLPSIMAALSEAQLSEPDEGTDDSRRVVLLDSYEHLEAIESSVRHELLRQVRSTTLLVIAGRMPPSAEWRALSLWGEAVIPLALRNLGPADASKYLARSGIHGETASAIIAFSHGHPMALALAAKAWQHTPETPFTPESAQDVITALYEYFLREVTDPHQRAALESSATPHTRLEAVETVLAALLESDATSAVAWLRGLRSIEADESGVLPRDSLREGTQAARQRWHPGRLALVAPMSEQLGAHHESEPLPPSSQGSALAVPSAEDFGVQVREALRTLHDVVALASNPLIYCRAVDARVGSAAQPRERAAALREWFMEEAEALHGSARGELWYRVLDATYLNPVGKHETAAATLGLSYSTFRRNLAAAIQCLITMLWQSELRSEASE